MTNEQHFDKCTLILDNTSSLYDREQAIFKVYMLTGEVDNFYRQLVDLGKHVVSQTNLSETADPFMQGKVFDLAVAYVFTYMLDDYHEEFIKWNEVQNDTVVAK